MLPKTERGGFSLLEVVIAMSVFVIGSGAILSTLIVGTSLRESTRETAMAVEAAQSAVERMGGADFSELFASFNSNPLDDPGAAGTAQGSSFAVPGLDAQEGDVDGLPGEIFFPGDGTILREDWNDQPLGMPRDLNGDGVIDALDHSLDYSNLAVRVRIVWWGSSGDREITIFTTFADI